eukprot:CAMPEP_0185606806 /NCGR_PEP_ID=MMETSP0436-20130131/5045_1 /TAXON_ID=626734 ORGANISM="Favella taraikaensis, Strain Fe Narragansett Bay" /NCGR_SAMPLE_ID=MMETSP0436 /ASSEMBLY_ACC=CAM_ASM_000390 /LENGTH=64 /DNA_ID=CAMNT_0028238505 /DNA_START=1447 /DNA_END=1638 /DNA_ORIENTATION=-
MFNSLPAPGRSGSASFKSVGNASSPSVGMMGKSRHLPCNLGISSSKSGTASETTEGSEGMCIEW